MFQKNKKILETFAYLGISLAVFIVFLFQTRASEQTSLFFLIIYLVIFFSAAELFELKLGIWVSGLAVFLQLLQGHFLIAVMQAGLTAYYFIIKKLLRAKMEQTTAREKYFRNLVDMSLQPIIIEDKEGEVLFVSKSIEQLLGLKKDALISKNIADFIHPDDISYYSEFIKQVLALPGEKKLAEFRIKKNGDWIWARNEAINLLDHKDIKAIIASLQDITTQKTLDEQKTELFENEKTARAMAEKAILDRDEFLSIASHELKTPLTTVLLQLQATLRKISTQSLADFSGGELLNSLQIAEKQSQNLSVLIKDLLNVSIASTGRITLNKEKVDLSELVENLPKKYDEEIKLSECSVHTQIKDHEVVGRWDPVRIEQAITNLFMNALRHAKGTKVILTVEKDEQLAIFKIKDSGKGIPAHLQQDIFEPFKSVTNNKEKGLGVGLFITRQIITAHGGQISVRSSPGKGSTFTVKLPL